MKNPLIVVVMLHYSEVLNKKYAECNQISASLFIVILAIIKFYKEKLTASAN